MFGARRDNEPAFDWAGHFAGLAAEARFEPLREFYRRGAPPADTPLADVELVALDLETTGLDPRRHGIVSFGLVPFTLERIRMSQALYRVVRPRRELEDRSITIHQITHQEVADAPDLAELVEPLLDALAGRVVVVHFHAIERRFLDQAFRRRFGEGLAFPLIDTMINERRVRQRPGFDPRRWFRRWRGSLRLADCRTRYHLPEYSPHHALTDAQATAELFQAQVAYHGSPEDRVEQWWL